jgi:hypothetical protein
MFRNLATLILYIGILSYNVSIPPVLLLFYTAFIFIGCGYAFFPKKVRKILYPINYFFENLGPVGYNIEFAPIVALSIYIFIKTILQHFYHIYL